MSDLTQEPSRRLDGRFAAPLVMLVGLGLYVATLAPDLLWGGGDFATYQTRAALGEIIGEGGVFDHPLWVLLAHPFTRLPLQSPAWRANLASAVMAALALGLVYDASWRLTRSIAGALLATGALGVSHTFWTYAVMPKVYALNALLLAGCLALLLRWREGRGNGWLVGAAWLYGLSFANHLVMATLAPGLAVYVLREARGSLSLSKRLRERPGFDRLSGRRGAARAGALAAAGFGAGLAPYLALVLSGGRAGATAGTLLGFAGGLAYLLGHPLALLKGLGWGALLGLYQFPLSFIAGLLGLAILWRRDRSAAWLLGGAIAGALAFMLAATDPSAGGVYVWNLHYYLQGYVPLAIAMAVGFARLWDSSRFQGVLRRGALVAATLALPVGVYLAAPPLARAVLPGLPDFRPLPGRDNFVYVLAPWKHHEHGARAYGEAILGALPEGSVLFADYSIWAVVRYLQAVEGQRPDVALVWLRGLEGQAETIVAYAGQGRLYLADTYRYYDLAGIGARFEIRPAGAVYELAARGG